MSILCFVTEQAFPSTNQKQIKESTHTGNQSVEIFNIIVYTI